MDAEVKSLAILVIAGAVSLAALAAWHHFRARVRLVQDLPTSKVAGVTLGLTELHGRAHTDHPTVSPHGQTDCVFWRQEIYVEETEGNGSSRWRKETERRGGRAHLDLVDDTGSIRVWCRDAHIEMPMVYEGSLYERPAPAADGLDLVAIRSGAGRRDRRVKEYALDIGTEVFVVGTAILDDDQPRPVIGPDPDAKAPFIVTTRDESQLNRNHSIAGWLSAAVAVISAAVFGAAWAEGAALFADGRGLSAVGWRVPAACVFLVLWAMFFLSLFRTYNGLVTLRNRAGKAWSLLGVEVTRRHSLLTPFVEIVRGHHAHEMDLHHRVAAIRAGWVPDLPGAPTDEAVAALDQPLELEARAVRDLLAVAEAYPDLRADESFRRLHRALVVTEDRIALARHFYNDSVERLRNRRASFPDSLVAWFFDLDLDGELTEYWDRRQPSQQAGNIPAAATT